MQTERMFQACVSDGTGGLHQTNIVQDNPVDLMVTLHRTELMLDDSGAEVKGTASRAVWKVVWKDHTPELVRVR